MTEDDDLRVTRIRPVANNSSSSPLSDLKKMFGGGGGNGGGRSGSRSSDPNWSLIMLIAIGLLLGLATFTSFYTVDISEEAVITRLGRYHSTSSSGFHFKLPFGIDRVQKVQSKRILQQEFGFRTRDTTGNRTTYDKEPYRQESLMLTGDLNVADVEWTLQYRIADPWKYLFHAVDVERNLRDVSMSIMRRVVGDRLVSDVLTTGRIEIADEAAILTQKVLDSYDLGVSVERVILQDATPPERVKPAFSEVNAAQQEQEQTINNAERQYNKIIPEARGKAKKLIADADAYAIDIVNRAKGDASQFEQVVSAYKKAPQVTRDRLYLETMQAVLNEIKGLTIVDNDIEGLLPLFQAATNNIANPSPPPSAH